MIAVLPVHFHPSGSFLMPQCWLLKTELLITTPTVLSRHGVILNCRWRLHLDSFAVCVETYRAGRMSAAILIQQCMPPVYNV